MISTKEIAKTRKQHQCELCTDILPVGSKAVKMAGVNDDNEFWNCYLCPTCFGLWEDRKFYERHIESDGWSFGTVKDIAWEYGFPSVAEMAAYWNEHKTLNER